MCFVSTHPIKECLKPEGREVDEHCIVQSKRRKDKSSYWRVSLTDKAPRLLVTRTTS